MHSVLKILIGRMEQQQKSKIQSLWLDQCLHLLHQLSKVLLLCHTNKNYIKKTFVRSGIRTHASNWRPEHSYAVTAQAMLESGALDRSAILTCLSVITLDYINYCQV